MKPETEIKLLVIIIALALLQVAVIIIGANTPDYDLNRDGVVDIKDLLKMQKRLLEE